MLILYVHVFLLVIKRIIRTVIPNTGYAASILDIACPLKNFGATKIKAPDHQTMNVKIK
jgi:hypothetical protein